MLRRADEVMIFGSWTVMVAHICTFLAFVYICLKNFFSPDTSDDDSPTSPQALSRSPKQPNGKKKVMMKRVSKYTNLIFNSAPKLLKKIKGYVFLSPFLFVFCFVFKL